MKMEEYYHGRKGRKYGIWNSVRKCFQFGICEDTPKQAVHRLHEKIGKDAYKWRFEPRALPKNAATQTMGPCGLCRYFPPSSLDGKPCTACPASPRK